MTDMQPTAVAAPIHLPPGSPSSAGFFDDLDALKLSLEDSGLAGAPEVVNLIPVRKPLKHEYFRIRPGDENCFTTMIYEDRETREYYFVAPVVIPLLRTVADLSVVSLVQFITKQGVLGIFPLKLATDSTARSGWYDTAMAAADLAKKSWVRMKADMALGGYRVYRAESDLGEPEWPETPFNELLDIAFRDRVIMDENHPVFNKLRGRI